MLFIGLNVIDADRRHNGHAFKYNSAR